MTATVVPIVWDFSIGSCLIHTGSTILFNQGLVFCTRLTIPLKYKDLPRIIGYGQASLLRILVRGDKHRLRHPLDCPRDLIVVRSGRAWQGLEIGSTLSPPGLKIGHPGLARMRGYGAQLCFIREMVDCHGCLGQWGSACTVTGSSGEPYPPYQLSF